MIPGQAKLIIVLPTIQFLIGQYALQISLSLLTVKSNITDQFVDFIADISTKSARRETKVLAKRVAASIDHCKTTIIYPQIGIQDSAIVTTTAARSFYIHISTSVIETSNSSGE